jgi:hypothetical protein
MIKLFMMLFVCFGLSEKTDEEYTSQLLNKRISLELHNVSTRDIVEKIKKQYSVPLSFINNLSLDKESSDFICIDCSLKDALTKLTSSSLYRYGVINKHLILYSSESRYQAIVKNVRIENKGRLLAISELIDKLRVEIPGFDLYPPPQFGSGEKPIYAENVTIESKDRSVLDCLMQALGENRDVVLSVEVATNGLPFLHLNMIFGSKSVDYKQ